jgi:hypothetical protein
LEASLFLIFSLALVLLFLVVVGAFKDCLARLPHLTASLGLPYALAFFGLHPREGTLFGAMLPTRECSASSWHRQTARLALHGLTHAILGHGVMSKRARGVDIAATSAHRPRAHRTCQHLFSIRAIMALPTRAAHLAKVRNKRGPRARFAPLIHCAHQTPTNNNHNTA